MAIDSTKSVTYYLTIASKKIETLGKLRHWDNLKFATEKDEIWLKDFTESQINSLAIKSLPFKKIYIEKGNKLFPMGSHLPEVITPSLLWTPIERAIQIEMPPYNHNYFGIQEKLLIQLVPASEEQPSFGLLTTIELLSNYIQTAPYIRLKNLYWVIISEKYAFILGAPILPLQGETYWKNKDMLLPTGYNFELPNLINFLDLRLNASNDSLVLWDINSSYSLIPKNNFIPLSKSSFTKSFSPIEIPKN